MYSRMQNLRKAGKNTGPILSRPWTKVRVVFRRYRRPLLVANAFSDCLYHVSFWRYRLLKLPLGCEVIEKRWFLSPELQGDGIPQISNMHFQIAVISEHATGFG